MKMKEFEIAPGRWIGGNNPCFIIAEIGQNHQGDMEIAKKMIMEAKKCGVDCVKFQKTHLSSRFNAAALARPYHSENSFGKTYGEHRRHLEFSNDDFEVLQKFAADCNIIFTASAMDEASLSFLHTLNVPFFKIGSGDANNLLLIRQAALLGKPLVISTGMQRMAMVEEIYETVRPLNPNFCILQCTSAYPTPYQEVHLRVIQTYQEKFPDAVIGYSGHEIGTAVSIAAVALGAKVIERHMTLNKTWKGSDHKASLQPEEFKRLVDDIRNVELSLGSSEKICRDVELPCFRKLGKTIVAVQDITHGTILSKNMMCIKVAEPQGCKAEMLNSLVGKAIKRDIKADESILEDDIL